jgi:hypothetical protein
MDLDIVEYSGEYFNDVEVLCSSVAAALEPELAESRAGS